MGKIDICVKNFIKVDSAEHSRKYEGLGKNVYSRLSNAYN